MRRVFLLLGVLTCVITSLAQDYPDFDGEIKWSELFEVSKRASSPEIIGLDRSSVYLIRKVKKKRYIEKYKLSSLQLQKSTELVLEYNGKDLDYDGSFMFGNTPVIYTSFYNKKTRKNYSFLQTIDRTTLAVSIPNPVDENELPQGKGLKAKLNQSLLGSYGATNPFLISDDREFGFLLQSKINPESYENGEITRMAMGGKLFDRDLKVLEENGFKFPYDNFLSTQIKLGNNGLVYFAGYQYETVEDESKKLIKREKTEYGDLEILVLDIESGEIEGFKVRTEGDVKGFSFKIGNDESIIVSGLVGEGSGVSGAFYTKYDHKLIEKEFVQVEFEEDFITQDWSEKKKEKFEKKRKKAEKKGQKKSEPTFYKYQMRDIIVKPNGSALLLAEQYYVRVVTTTYTDANGNIRTRTTYYYYYNDIIAMNFDKNGELEWKTIIDKYQVSTNDGGYYSSFFTVQKGNDIHIIYNDRKSETIDTEGMTKSEISKLRRKTVGKDVLINADGEISESKLFEFEEGGLRIVAKTCQQVDEDVVFLYARGRKGDKIGTIEL